MQPNTAAIFNTLNFRLPRHVTVNEVKQSSIWRFSRDGFRKSVEAHCLNGVKQFKKLLNSYIFFHLFFLGLLVAETVAFFVFLTLLFQTSFIAFSLAAILFTGFAYLILLFYFQTKKPGQFLELRNWFMMMCKDGLPKNLHENDYHLSLANAAYRFSTHLNSQEAEETHVSSGHVALNHAIKKFTHLYLKKDLHKMKEILLLVSINEHIQLIKRFPTNLEAHASLANTYIVLSELYSARQERHQREELTRKSKNAMEQAIEEFKIIDHYSPNDPWVLAQLATCYHNLQIYDEEIRLYESILQLCPQDKQVMFRLGILYFQQGHNAQGLAMYEKLKELNFSRAEELIDFYDANIKREYRINTL